MRTFMRSKIHKATVTHSDASNTGGITIDKTLLEKSDIDLYEKVLIVSNTSGHRLETYVTEGPENSGKICINGAASHLIKAG
ncbi:aspartate 1-decarboxylase [Rubidibacter lacunae]|uniref:aspartate 1-decarboxylase n=1 Tax=Rubidibacter lacunae TaxID=582514 RepID=UPI001E5455D2|nr:aspartate 1-decarboxylase [Rubidibacter lacunae]